MRRLLLLRHAKAGRAAAGTPDRDRALIERGRRDADRIGAYMASHGLTPERAILSPALRVQQTWRQTAAALQPAPAVATVETLYDATAHTIFALVKETPASVHSLLVVGHNPGLHELALMLIASGEVETRERLREELPTSALAVVDFAFDEWSRLHPRSGRLERFVRPRMLEVHSEEY